MGQLALFLSCHKGRFTLYFIQVMDKREPTSSNSSKVSPRGTALVTPSPRKTGLIIFGTIADTTWRLFAPVIGLLLVGMWLDGKTHHKPLFTLSGILLGCVLAFLLVQLQYRQVIGDNKK
jgi:hypothetical protein